MLYHAVQLFSRKRLTHARRLLYRSGELVRPYATGNGDSSSVHGPVQRSYSESVSYVRFTRAPRPATVPPYMTALSSTLDRCTSTYVGPKRGVWVRPAQDPGLDCLRCCVCAVQSSSEEVRAARATHSKLSEQLKDLMAAVDSRDQQIASLTRENVTKSLQSEDELKRAQAACTELQQHVESLRAQICEHLSLIHI